ncbi:hypothetical protein ACWPM1_05315 [Tsuneonella sp. HG249]
MKISTSSIAILSALLLASCSQEHAPSESISEAADTVVEKVEGEEPTPFAKGEFAPRDECADVPGAAAFRAQLAAAVEARDAAKLIALAAPDVQLDFGGGAGTAELRSRLTEEEGALWSELDALMALGCAANEAGGITLPWFFDRDFGTRDPMMTMIVTGEDVPAYRSAESGKPAGSLSWDAVELEGFYPERARQQVKTAEGETLFVATDKLRSVIDYRLIASSRDGKWSFTSLIAGD